MTRLVNHGKRSVMLGLKRAAAVQAALGGRHRAYDADRFLPEAGVSERTFLRYFSSKASVLWTEFETEVDTIRAALSSVPGDVPMMTAIRDAVVSANHYQAEDVPQMRMRMNLFATIPALSASAAEHYEA